MTQKPRRHGRRRGRGPKGRGPRTPKIKVEPLHPTAEPPDVHSFREWELGDEIQQGIANMDIEVPTAIQKLSIQPILDGKDLIAKAETGTGKTLAFGAPMMSRIDPERSTVLGLVLCPTRELAQQVGNVLQALGAPRGVRVALIVGGDPMHPQVAELRAGAQVVVGTPGRVLDLYQQRFLSFPWTEYAVLDEADKMFEIGFIDEVRKILSYLPDERQTLLFSATFPSEVLSLAREFTKSPDEVATASGLATVDAIEQHFIPVASEDRPLALTRLIEQSGRRDVFLVFCERRTDVDRLLLRMQRETFPVKALHGGYDQASRFRVMSAFRAGEVKALLATDVASRGLDVEHVTHVINYSVPREVEEYTHRIGRTGRAGRSGAAITFVTPEDRGRWGRVKNRVSWDIREMDVPERTGSRGSERGRDRSRSRERDGDREGARGRDRERETRSETADAPRRRRRRGGRGSRSGGDA